MPRIVGVVITLLALSTLAVGCGGSASSSAVKPTVRHGIAHNCSGNTCTVQYSGENVPTASQLTSVCSYGRISSVAPVDVKGLDGQTSELIVVCAQQPA